MKNKILSSLFSLLLVFSSAAIFANNADSDINETKAGVETHDGFFLRFLLGAGYQYMEYSDAPNPEFSGLGSVFNFQIGGAPFNNFILFAQVGGFAIGEPDVKDQYGRFGDKVETVGSVGFGGGLSYYIMPINIYLSLAASYSQTFLEDERESYESNPGLGISFAVGKEWWISENWGLGVALVGEFSTMKNDGEQHKWENYYGGIAFSATYN